ncbi:hypothetical protein ACIO02_27215 [Streptomyces sp. NPDC087568]|uniref:hypothetical protein n=1 Tax=unclassified Streptomyces TaxID=2593676 RepID=UPI0037FC91A5
MPGGDSFSFGHVTGPVNAGSGQQYVAGRDQTVHQGSQAGHQQLLAEVTALRQALGGLQLTDDERRAADGELRDVRQALNRGEPDREGAARHLRAFTEGLRQAGALASAGTSVVGALSALAHWLGPLGAGVLALL